MPPEKIKGLYRRRGKTYWLAHQKNKRRVFVSLETSDYVEAVKKASLILTRPELNPTAGLKSDINEFCIYQVRTKRWTLASEDSKGPVLRKFGEWIEWRRIDSIRPRDIQDYYDWIQDSVSEGSAQTYLMILRSFFKWAAEQNLIRENPVCGVKVGRIISAPRRKFCTFEQRDEILAGAPTPWLKFIFFCGFHAGMRKNEIIQARPDWFDLRNGVIHVKKTETFQPKDKEERTIPMTKEFGIFLFEYGFREPFMLRPDVDQGKHLYRYDFDRPYFAYLGERYRWVTAHVMRHTFGSLLASRGCSIYKIAVWMGDEVKTAQRHYAHLLPADSDIELGVSPASKRATQS